MTAQEILYGLRVKDQPIPLDIDKYVKENEQNEVDTIQNISITENYETISGITIIKENNTYYLQVDGEKKGEGIVIESSSAPTAITYDSVSKELVFHFTGGTEVRAHFELDAYTKSESDLLFAPIEHSHEISDVSGLTDALGSKASNSDLEALGVVVEGKANSVHTHSQADVSGLTAALDSKVDDSTFQEAISAKADASSVTALSGQVTTLETTVSGKADASDVTALSGQVTTLETTVSGKADASSVTELSGQVTTLETTVAGKADANHTHSQISDGSMSNLKFVVMTKADYEALATKDDNIIYLVKET